MQSQLVAMLVLTSWTQVRGDERPHLEPRRVRQGPAIRIVIRNDSRDVTLEMPAQAAPAVEDDDDRPARPVMPVGLDAAMVERENFDRWLFDHDLSEQARQEHLKDILDAKIDLAASAHKLTDPQRAKLRLAGRGDIKRFFDEVQKRRDDFEVDRKTFNTGLTALRRLDKLSPSYREGPFGVGSLFAKTLHKINNDRKAVD